SGNTNYNAAPTITRQALVYGTAGAGSFVIGDKSYAAAAANNGTITLWGSQWSKQNVLSGASADAASFKGFASSLSGSGWTAAPGNSGNPPSSVPAYMSMVVTTKINKSGNNLTGDIVKTVIVKVDPGYSDNPGHAATGAIIATLP